MKPFYLICIFCLLSACAFSQKSSDTLDTDMSEPKFGVGFQYSYPYYGLTAVYKFKENMSMQIIGSFGFYRGGSLRYAYHFNGVETVDYSIKPYAYGQAGFFAFGNGFGNFTALNATLGAGAEYYLTYKTPNLRVRTEIGLTRFFNDGFNSFPLTYGGGILYYF